LSMHLQGPQTRVNSADIRIAEPTFPTPGRQWRQSLWHASIERVSQREISPGIFPGILWVLRPLRSHLSEEGARLVIGRNLRQLQAMSG
jgi:hypothetical protein